MIVGGHQLFLRSNLLNSAFNYLPRDLFLVQLFHWIANVQGPCSTKVVLVQLGQLDLLASHNSCWSTSFLCVVFLSLPFSSKSPFFNCATGLLDLKCFNPSLAIFFNFLSYSPVLSDSSSSWNVNCAHRRSCRRFRCSLGGRSFQPCPVQSAERSSSC